MNTLLFTLTKAAISGVIIAVVSTMAKKDNLIASIIHSLPLLSVLSFLWLYIEARDTALIARHAVPGLRTRGDDAQLEPSHKAGTTGACAGSDDCAARRSNLNGAANRRDDLRRKRGSERRA